MAQQTRQAYAQASDDERARVVPDLRSRGQATSVRWRPGRATISVGSVNVGCAPCVDALFLLGSCRRAPRLATQLTARLPRSRWRCRDSTEPDRSCRAGREDPISEQDHPGPLATIHREQSCRKPSIRRLLVAQSERGAPLGATTPAGESVSRRSVRLLQGDRVARRRKERSDRAELGWRALGAGRTRTRAAITRQPRPGRPPPSPLGGYRARAGQAMADPRSRLAYRLI